MTKTLLDVTHTYEKSWSRDTDDMSPEDMQREIDMERWLINTGNYDVMVRCQEKVAHVRATNQN